MISLVSPEYNLEAFCNHMRGKALLLSWRPLLRRLAMLAVSTVKPRKTLISVRDRKACDTVKTFRNWFSCLWTAQFPLAPARNFLP